MFERIFLVGYRGVGKTTVGKKLAEELGYSFVDTDHVICELTGQAIKTIVENDGWESFRRQERETLEGLAKKRRCVISTGGGAVLHQRFWAEQDERSRIIWLWAPRDIIMERLLLDNSQEMRPSLLGKGLREELDELLTKREPMYQEISHIKINTGEMVVKSAVAAILAELDVKSKQE